MTCALKEFPLQWEMRDVYSQQQAPGYKPLKLDMYSIQNFSDTAKVWWCLYQALSSFSGWGEAYTCSNHN